jgi:2'-5' RNA ligase
MTFHELLLQLKSKLAHKPNREDELESLDSTDGLGSGSRGPGNSGIDMDPTPKLRPKRLEKAPSPENPNNPGKSLNKVEWLDKLSFRNILFKIKNHVAKKPLSKEAYEWLHSWSFTRIAPKLTDQLIKEFSQYKPSTPVKLYRAEDVTSSETKTLKSWTYEKGMTEFMQEVAEQEGHPDKIVIREEIIDPVDILIDFTKLPDDLKGDFLNEVIVFSGLDKSSSVLDYPKPGLDPQVWQADGTMHTPIKQEILKKLSDFFQSKGVKKEVKKFVKYVNIIGSLTTYQYNSKSDLDVHVGVHLNAFKDALSKTTFWVNDDELVDLLNKHWKDELNEIDPKVAAGTAHPIEYFFEIEGYYNTNRSDGIYSLLKNKWKKEPRTVDYDFDLAEYYPKIVEEANQFLKDIDSGLGEVQRNIGDIALLKETVERFPKEKRKLFKKKIHEKIEQINQNISSIVETGQEIIDQRKQEYAPTSVSNILFKYLQRYGYVWLIKQLEDVLENDVTEEVNIEDLNDVKELEQILDDFECREDDTVKLADLYKPEFYYYILNNFPVAKSAIRKISKYTEDWKSIELTADELGWIRNMPLKYPPKSNKIYRGMFIKDLDEFKVGQNITYEPKGQFSSWALDLSNVEYFQRGPGFPVTLVATLPTDYFSIVNFFKLVDELDVYFFESADVLTKEEEKIENIISDIQLFKENEVWIFGSIEAKVMKNASTQKLAQYDMCTIQTSEIPEDVTAQIRKIQESIPKEKLNSDADEPGWVEGGIQELLHATILYGINIKDLDKAKEIYKKYPKIEIEAKELGFFDIDEPERDAYYTAAYVACTSPELKKLHEEMRSNIENQHDKEFHVHITVAYLNYGERIEGDIEPMKWGLDNAEMIDTKGQPHKLAKYFTTIKGWITDRGEFKPVYSPREHVDVAQDFGFIGVIDSIKAGWIHVGTYSGVLDFTVEDILLNLDKIQNFIDKTPEAFSFDTIVLADLKNSFIELPISDVEKLGLKKVYNKTKSKKESFIKKSSLTGWIKPDDVVVLGDHFSIVKKYLPDEGDIGFYSYDNLFDKGWIRVVDTAKYDAPSESMIGFESTKTFDPDTLNRVVKFIDNNPESADRKFVQLSKTEDGVSTKELLVSMRDIEKFGILRAVSKAEKGKVSFGLKDLIITAGVERDKVWIKPDDTVISIPQQNIWHSEFIKDEYDQDFMGAILDGWIAKGEQEDPSGSLMYFTIRDLSPESISRLQKYLSDNPTALSRNEGVEISYGSGAGNLIRVWAEDVEKYGFNGAVQRKTRVPVTAGFGLNDLSTKSLFQSIFAGKFKTASRDFEHKFDEFIINASDKEVLNVLEALQSNKVNYVKSMIKEM